MKKYFHSRFFVLFSLLILIIIGGFYFNPVRAEAMCKIWDYSGCGDDENCQPTYVDSTCSSTPIAQGASYTTPINVTVNNGSLNSAPAGFAPRYTIWRVKSGGTQVSTVSNLWGNAGAGAPDSAILKTCQAAPSVPFGWFLASGVSDWPSGYYLKQSPSVSGGKSCDTSSTLSCTSSRSTCSAPGNEYISGWPSTQPPMSNKANQTTNHITGFQMDFCSYGTVNVNIKTNGTAGLPTGYTNYSIVGPFGLQLPVGNTTRNATAASNPWTDARLGTYTISGTAPAGYTATITPSSSQTVACASGETKTFEINFTSAALPDLTGDPGSSIQVLDPTTGNPLSNITTNSQVKLSGNVKNIGTVTTGTPVSAFHNFFEIQYPSGSNPAGKEVVSSDVSTPLNSGSTATTTISSVGSPLSPFFPFVGTSKVRVCADETQISGAGALITESDETNNCGPWTNVTISSGATPLSCSITSTPSSGNITLNTTLSATGSGGTAPYTYKYNCTTNGSYTSTSSCSYSTAGGYTAWGQVTDSASTIATCSTSVSATNSGYTLTVSKAGTGTGTVTSSPSGINCGATCSYSYTSGTSVTLTATPTTGTFAGWSGACTGAGTCAVTMSAAKSVTATFTSTPLGITVSPTAYSSTLSGGASPAISATYTVTNGTGATCRLLDNAGAPLNAYAACSTSMSVDPPDVAGAYAYSIQAFKSSTNETVTSNQFIVTVGSAFGVTVNPTAYSSTLSGGVSPAISATYTLTNGTGATCRLLDNTGSPLNSYTACSGTMPVNPPDAVGPYAYSIQAFKSSTNETVTSNQFIVTVGSTFGISVSPTTYSSTISSGVSPAISATYTLIDGTGATCRLLDNTGTPLNAYTACSTSMSVDPPDVAGPYAYSIQAFKSSTNETVTSNQFIVTVSAAPCSPNQGNSCNTVNSCGLPNPAGTGGTISCDGTCSVPIDDSTCVASGCQKTHYHCATGYDSVNNAQIPLKWTWNCKNNTTQVVGPQCSELKKKPVIIEN